MIRSILWFRQDLRLHDNEALIEASRNSDELIPVFIFHPEQFLPVTIYKTPKTSAARTKFLLESIANLRQQLRNMGTDLVVRIGDPGKILYSLASEHKIHFIYCNRERTREEVDIQDQLEKKMWTIGCEVRYSRGKMLYYTSDLPFPVTHSPDSFPIFKKEIEQIIPVRMPLDIPGVLPPMTTDLDSGFIPEVSDLLPDIPENNISHFKGGESTGLKWLHENKPNIPAHLLGGEGTLLSPWIAMGCLSPKKVYYNVATWQGGDEIRHHLIYRDYLRLMAKKYGDMIFNRSGIKGIRTTFKRDDIALDRWKKGTTGVPIIDAAMHQLSQTGWLPDTLRRLVALYFVKIMQLDWRLGAAYFESTLIDYDPCTNWVSWLNIAGFGPDSREDRTINFEAVGKRMDPEGIYINAWMSQVS